LQRDIIMILLNLYIAKTNTTHSKSPLSTEVRPLLLASVSHKLIDIRKKRKCCRNPELYPKSCNRQTSFIVKTLKATVTKDKDARPRKTQILNKKWHTAASQCLPMWIL